MTVTVTPTETRTDASLPWRGFRTGLWQTEINVRDFIQQNYEEYPGDASFLSPATDRTTKIWDTLTALFVEERRKGVLAVSQVPSSITAHAPPVAAPGDRPAVEPTLRSTDAPDTP